MLKDFFPATVLQIKGHILLRIYKLVFINRAKKVQNLRCSMKYNFTGGFVATLEPYERRSFILPWLAGSPSLQWDARLDVAYLNPEAAVVPAPNPLVGSAPLWWGQAVPAANPSVRSALL